MALPVSRVFQASTLAALIAATVPGPAIAAPVAYVIDPTHTFPSFEADHMGGLSVWRGKFNTSSGMVHWDKAAKSGDVTIAIDMASADFGHDELNKVAQSDALFETAKFPTATYTGTLADFVGGKPTRVAGTLTLHGVTRPVALELKSFKCMPHPMLKREVCGADAYAVIDRETFGMAAGKDYGFNMDVVLRIQVEAIAAE